MSSVGSSAVGMLKPPQIMPMHGGGELSSLSSLKGDGKADDVRDKFTQFVGEAFFGQMMKAMRSTVGKPAYFYGGRAEEVFQGQLDQTMSEQLTKASASKFADPMFERQFPQFAQAQPASGMNDLGQLRRQ
jgi:Rod binding domain-containing protein